MEVDAEGNFYPNGVESVGKTLFRCLGKWQNNIGQIEYVTGKEDKFGDMRLRAIRTAIKLQSMGFGRRDIISTCSFNHLNSRIPTLASFFIGAIPSYFDPNLPELDTISLLNLMQPKIMFIAPESLHFIEKCLSKAKVSTKIVVFGEHDNHTSFEEFLKQSPKEISFVPVEIEDVRETAVVLFSSGTTGNPKGICLSHLTLLNPSLLEGFDDILSRPGSVYLIYSTLYWISGIIFLIQSILTGAKKILCRKFDPSEFWTIVERYKVELSFITPYYGVDCFKCNPPKVDTSSMKILITGSCRVTKQFMDDFHGSFPNAVILNIYGMTETGGITSKFNPTKPEEVQMQLDKPQCVGRVQPYMKWKVVDPDSGKVLGPNQKGELLLKSRFLLNGYYKQDHSYIYDQDGYMRTGDIVHYDEDNCLFVEDRAKEMFKYRGWHIMPSVVEEVISRHPAVKRSIVIGIPHEDDGHRPMALVVLEDNFSADVSQEILDFVNSSVSDAQKLRAGLRILRGDLPKTATGKLKRESVRQMVLAGAI